MFIKLKNLRIFDIFLLENIWLIIKSRIDDIGMIDSYISVCSIVLVLYQYLNKALTKRM